MKSLLVLFLRISKGVQKTWWFIIGTSESRVHEKEVVTGKVWEDFCDHLKTATAALHYPGAPNDPMNQAEGIRYLSRLTRAALEAFVEYNDPKYPEFRRTVHETIKMGADNPDNHYLNAQIDGNNTYTIRGKRNSIHYFGLFTQNGNYGTTGGLAPCGHLEWNEIAYGEDGTFEIHIGPEPRGPNWLKATNETSLIMVRQTYADRSKEVPAEFEITCDNPDGIPGSIEPARLVEGLNTAVLFVAGAPMLFSKWAKGFQKHSNTLPLFDPATSNAAGGDANIFYYHSHWKLERDEYLEINVTPPACDTWNFQLNNYWMESLDYRYHDVCINGSSADYNEDGSVTIIVSHERRDAKNWISTAGHSEGTMCWRWYRPENDVMDLIPTRTGKYA